MKPCLIFFLFSLAGCANFTVTDSDSLKRISLSQVEQLTMGKSTKENLVQLFGLPSTVLSPAPFESWIYDGPSGQRAAFTMDSKGVIVSSLWIPITGRECSDKNCLLSHFKNISFKFEKKAEQLSKHETAYYLSYSNPEAGISINLPTGSDEVTEIKFDLPLNERSPAASVKQKL
jgi:hypothetical protein